MEKRNKVNTKQKFISKEQQEQIRRFFNNSKPNATLNKINENTIVSKTNQINGKNID